MADAAAGSAREAFALRVAEEIPGLYRYALAVVRDGDRAEDLVGETVLRALERQDQFRGDAALRTWLHSILAHLAIDRGRHAAHETSVARVEEAWRDDHYTVDPSVVAEHAHSRGLLERALGTLSEGYRAVLVLHDAEGWSSREIAEALGLSVAATKQRLRRARMMLVTALADGGTTVAATQQELAGCWAARRLVSAYLDGELDAADRATVDAHLARCRTCPPLAQALTQATASLRGLREGDASEVTRRLVARCVEQP